MKTKTPKPRVMWAIYDSGRDPVVSGNRSLIRICERSAGVKAIRVAVIPLDVSIVGICAALTAAGIPCKRKARK